MRMNVFETIHAENFDRQHVSSGDDGDDVTSR